MGEDRRSAGRRSEIELSTLPEVAALATELTLIFKSLGISQQQYAIRANYDKSYVSRFLNGRRVATKEFVDRLLCEVESHRQTSITNETRARLDQLRNNALRVYDPELFKLETMRSEVSRHQREVKRLLLHQEALEGLLERRQAEAEESRRELAQAQSDWIADRVRSDAELLVLKGERQRYQDEREELLEEITRLRAELRNTVEQKKQAERRCAQLEEQVVAAEIEVAERREREGVDSVDLPVTLVVHRLQKAEENEIYRELAEFALSRAGADIVQLSLWLFSEEMEAHAEQLLTDYCRQRPIRNTVDLVLDVERVKHSESCAVAYERLASQLSTHAARRSFEDLLEFCTLYAEAHQHADADQRIIDLADTCYRWFGHHRRLPGRAEKFLDVVDHLIDTGERKDSDNLVRKIVTLTGISSVFGRVIAESGREAEIKIIVTEFLESVKRRTEFHPLLRQIAKADEYSNPLMVNLLISGLCDVYDPMDLQSILMGTLTSKWGAGATDRIADEIVARGLGGEVRHCMERVFVVGERDGEIVRIEYTPEVERLLNRLSSD